MNLNNSLSSMKKYQFFEECQEKNTNANKTSSLTLNDIFPSGINQMQSIEDIILMLKIQMNLEEIIL